MEQLTLGWVLLASTLFGTTATGSRRDARAISEKVMDMARYSFDDQYQDCSRMMEEKLKTVNRTEFKNKVYKDTWKNASEHWQKQWGNSNRPQVLPQEQAVAVLAYTHRGDLSNQLNTAMHKGGRSPEHYLESFPFKTLHFLLTEALHTLRDDQGRRCYNVSRGVNGTRFTAHLKETVRFGHFASASLNESIAKGFGTDTFFVVNTCYGVSIGNFSFSPEQEEVLIPPYEVFRVTNYTCDRDGTVIHLHSQTALSTYNCEFLKATCSRRDVCAITEKVMDMAQDSFDDQYLNCSRMMEEKLKTVNRNEFQNKVYADTWREAAKHWQKQWGNSNRPQVLPQEQAVAVLAYTDGGHLYKQFNTLVREGGCSREHYLQHFPFKTLHFLLTEAVHTLQKTQRPKCNRVYRGIKGIRFMAQLNQTVRFGQFASASFNKNIAQDFGTDTFFVVNTCYGVSIRSFSFYPEQEEVLIPPYEVFKVTKVICYTDGTHIHLDSHSRHSNYNCALLKEKRCKAQPCVFSAGTSSPREPPHLWSLLLAAAALAAVGRL
nr:erythroblast NAD(P)(+)--arginine ADP-ribosyltransferase-like isoform X3 [Anas platyrhynchos]